MKENEGCQLTEFDESMNERESSETFHPNDEIDDDENSSEETTCMIYLHNFNIIIMIFSNIVPDYEIEYRAQIINNFLFQLD